MDLKFRLGYMMTLEQLIEVLDTCEPIWVDDGEIRRLDEVEDRNAEVLRIVSESDGITAIVVKGADMRLRDIKDPTFEQVYKVLNWCARDHHVDIVVDSERIPIRYVDAHAIKDYPVKSIDIDKHFIVIEVDV